MAIERSSIKVKFPEGYLKYRQENGMTHDMLIQRMWTNYLKGGTFSEEDQKVLDAAVKRTDLSEEESIRQGSLSFAKKMELFFFERFSTTKKPILCLFFEYFFPGFPNPITYISFIMYA